MVQSPKTPESRKYEKKKNEENAKSPTPRSPPPENTKKTTEKIQKWPRKIAILCIFVGNFFVFSGGDLGSGILYFFRNFFVYPGFRGCWALYHAPRDRKSFGKGDFSRKVHFLEILENLVGEGQKGTPGRERDRKCHDRASLSRPLVLSSPLTSLTSFRSFLYFRGH